MPVCAPSFTQYNPQLVTDGANGAIISWQDYRNEVYPNYIYHIYAQHLDGNGLINSSTLNIDFTDSGDTAAWAYESLSGALGTPSVDWLTVYGNETGVMKLQFTSPNQGIK